MNVSDSKSAEAADPVAEVGGGRDPLERRGAPRRPPPARAVGSSPSPDLARRRAATKRCSTPGVVERRPLGREVAIAVASPGRGGLIACRLFRHGDGRVRMPSDVADGNDRVVAAAVGPRPAGPCARPGHRGFDRERSDRHRTQQLDGQPGREHAVAERVLAAPARSAADGSAVQGVAGSMVRGRDRSAGTVRGQRWKRASAIVGRYGGQRHDDGCCGASRSSRPWRRRRARPCGGRGWSVPPGRGR